MWKRMEYYFLIIPCILFKCLEKMAHNVPVVYDVLAARIEKCVAFLGTTKCGGVLAWEWSEAE
jgi:hypothetical protein